MKKLKKILYIILLIVGWIVTLIDLLCFPFFLLPEMIGYPATRKLIESMRIPLSLDVIELIGWIGIAASVVVAIIKWKVSKKTRLLLKDVGDPIEYFIRFEGELSGECRDYALLKIKRTVLLIAILIGLPWVVIVSLMAIFAKEFALIFLLLNIVPILGSLIFWVLESKPKRLEKSIPQSVFIEADKQFVEMKNNTFFKGALRPVETVKEIRDYGEFYQLVLRLDGANNLFICQKSLLTVGTLEDFERFFEDKIVKMQPL